MFAISEISFSLVQSERDQISTGIHRYPERCDNSSKHPTYIKYTYLQRSTIRIQCKTNPNDSRI